MRGDDAVALSIEGSSNANASRRSNSPPAPAPAPPAMFLFARDAMGETFRPATGDTPGPTPTPATAPGSEALRDTEGTLPKIPPAGPSGCMREKTEGESDPPPAPPRGVTAALPRGVTPAELSERGESVLKREPPERERCFGKRRAVGLMRVPDGGSAANTWGTVWG